MKLHRKQRICRKRSLSRALAAVALTLGAGSVARAVVTGNAAANSTGVYSGTGISGLDGTTVFGFDHVGLMHASTVYLGNGWVLSAEHVEAGEVVLGGGVYASSGTGGALTQANSANSNNYVDLRVELLAPNAAGLPNLAPMPLATVSPSLGTRVTLIGQGDTNAGAAPSYYNFTNTGTAQAPNLVWSAPSSSPTGADAGGFQLTTENTVRWGISTTQADVDHPGSPTFVYVDPGTTRVFTFLELPFFTGLTNYNTSNANTRARQASFASGDSGGGLFANGRLVGIADRIATFDNQPPNTTLFGDLSLPLDIATYATTILTATKQGQWNASGGGAWSSANWYGYTPNDVGASANFADTITTDATVTINSAITLANINFNNTHSVTVTGGSILLSYPDPAGGLTPRFAMLNTYAGTHTITTPLTLGQLTKVQVNTAGGALVLSGGVTNAGAVAWEKIGPGALTMSGTQNHAAGTVFTVSGGTLNLQNDLGAVGQMNVQLNVTSTATHAVTFTTSQHVAGLNLANGTDLQMTANGHQAIVVGSGGLQMAGGTGAWGGKINLVDNEMVVNYADSTAAGAGLTTITDMIKQASSGGSWTGAGGITSSAANAAYTAHANTPYTALGVAIAGQLPLGGALTGMGEALDPNAVLVKYTYMGDANLDGVLNIDDFIASDRGFARGLSGWANGDFNYDGTVDGTDLTLLANVFAIQGGPLNASFAAELYSLAGTAPTAIPEPASLAVLALGAGMLLRRRLK